MGKGAERRALRRLKRQDARAARREARSAQKTQRQANRQGFLSGIIGEKGLGGLAEDFGFGGDDTGYNGGGKAGDGGEEKDNTMMYVLIGLGAYFLMQKK